MKIIKSDKDVLLEQEAASDYFPCVHGKNVFDVEPCADCEELSSEDEGS